MEFESGQGIIQMEQTRDFAKEALSIKVLAPKISEVISWSYNIRYSPYSAKHFEETCVLLKKHTSANKSVKQQSLLKHDALIKTLKADGFL
jgi:hypothetical protein